MLFIAVFRCKLVVSDIFLLFPVFVQSGARVSGILPLTRQSRILSCFLVDFKSKCSV